MSVRCGVKMTASIYFLLIFSLAAARPLQRPLSHFQLAFEEVLQANPPSDIKGVTPANTYPLVLQPLNFAPAVVAPPSYLFPNPIRSPFNRFGGSTVPGAIPLFKPLRDFPFLHLMPVTTSFYLSEPNVRNPFGLPEVEPFPGKVSAPRPAFSAIRDTQIMRRPEKIFEDSLYEEEEDPEDEVQFVEVIQFPTEIAGGSTFEMRDADSDAFDFKLSAPGGIVQSGQPSFERLPFTNSKISPYLLSSPLKDLIRRDGDVGPTVIEV